MTPSRSTTTIRTSTSPNPKPQTPNPKPHSPFPIRVLCASVVNSCSELRTPNPFSLCALCASVVNSRDGKVSFGESEQHFDKIRIGRRKGAFGEKGDIDQELVYYGR